MNKINKYKSPLIDKLLKETSPAKLEKIEKRMLLATRIDDAIKAKGWKKKDFANVLNKNSSEITKWLSGTHNFTFDTLCDIERVLNISLVNLDDKKPEIIKTYIYCGTTKSSGKPQYYWRSLIYNTKSFYTGKSQFNTAHSN